MTLTFQGTNGELLKKHLLQIKDKTTKGESTESLSIQPTTDHISIVGETIPVSSNILFASPTPQDQQSRLNTRDTDSED